MSVVGFTAGAFDMFHIGHLNLIENAKAQCDFLIVGVNSDELIAGYKQKKAVVPFGERIRIVASIKSVDEVIRVDTLDKEALWYKCAFDFLFIGDDWKGHPRWEETERIMSVHNVKTIYLPYTRSTNSTLLREKLQDY